MSLLAPTATAIVLLVFAVTAFAAPVTIEGHEALTDLPGAMVLIFTGALIGIIGTLIGAGGGFIHVPILIIFYGFSPQHAIGTSMAAVFLNALSGSFSYMVQKRIDYEIGLKFSVAAVPGVCIGAASSQLFSIFSFSIIFGLLLGIMSFYLFSGKELSVIRLNAVELPMERCLIDSMGQTYTYSPDMPLGLTASFFVGFVSGLFGIGGGIIHVPLMYSVLGMPVHIAAATSHFILAITSFFGVIAFIGLQSIDMDYAIFLGIGTIFGAYLGAKVALQTHPHFIKKVIAVCLFLFAIKLIGGII